MASPLAGLAPLAPFEDSLALVRGFQASGDRALLNALLDRYYDRVRRIARIRMGSKLRRFAESDDLVQDTFAAAFSKIAELDLEDQSSLIRYLTRVLENQIRGSLDYMNAQKRQPLAGRVVSAAGQPDGAGEPLAAVPSSDPSPQEALHAKELAELYDSCVQSMDALHREVIVLKEYAHAEWEDIAAALDRPSPHAARLLYSRARIKLASVLREAMED